VPGWIKGVQISHGGHLFIKGLHIVGLLLVFDQSISLEEFRGAVIAFVHLFARVNSSVLFVNVRSHELLPAVFALERFVSTMNDAMLAKIAAQREPLAALVTFKRFLVGRVTTEMFV